jgi:hypothetical protein
MDRSRSLPDEGYRHDSDIGRGRLKKRLIADELVKALRCEEEAADKGACPREPNFNDLYQELGDAKAQENIRAANEDQHHCAYLKRCPNACEEFPEAIGDAKIGAPCPANPYEKHSELFAKLGEHAALLQYAHYIGNLVELGRLPGPEELSAEDFTIAVAMRKRAKVQELEAMSLGAIRAAFGSGNQDKEDE